MTPLNAFATAVALAAVVVAIWTTRWRLRAQGALAALAAQRREQERSSRELQDSLLQEFQGLVLRLQAVAGQVPGDAPTRILIEHALERADRAAHEVRERISSAREKESESMPLVDALTHACDAIAEDADGARIVLRVHGQVRPLHPIARQTAYWIAREALGNCLRHARPALVEVNVHFEPCELRLRVRDDGRGIPVPNRAEAPSTRQSGFAKARVRALSIRSTVQVWSRPGAGTELELRVPAAVGYRRQTTWRTSWPAHGSGSTVPLE